MSVDEMYNDADADTIADADCYLDWLGWLEVEGELPNEEVELCELGGENE